MATTPMRELAEIVQLQKGRHRRPDDGVCAMELVAWMSGERHTDHPQSVSPVIAAFTRAFNDALDPPHRQRLAILAARMIGTRGTREEELERCEALWCWMIGSALPTLLAAARRPDLAAAVVTDRATALDSVIEALDVYGHASVRPVDDHQISAHVSSALAVAGVVGACLAGRDAADGARSSRARRRWENARVVARAAAWSVAEVDGVGTEEGHGRLWQTAEGLRESAFLVLERLVGAGEAYPPPPPPPSEPGAPTCSIWWPDTMFGDEPAVVPDAATGLAAADGRVGRS